MARARGPPLWEQAHERDKAREHLTTALTMYREMEMQYRPEQEICVLRAL